MINIVISGISGRMGKEIGLLASQDKDFNITGAFEVKESIAVGKDIGSVLGIGDIGKKVESDFAKFKGRCDALIEFTSPEATMEHLRAAVSNNMGMVIGTTALTASQIDKIKKASEKIPIVFSPNMSVGANLLFKLTEEVSGLLGADYEVEIVEAHHNKKKDSPSGTAKSLGEVISKTRGKTPPIHSVRAGDIVGDHTVIFAGKGERIELTHRAHTRDAFAEGALQAAKFIKDRKSGLYSMREVIEG